MTDATGAPSAATNTPPPAADLGDGAPAASPDGSQRPPENSMPPSHAGLIGLGLIVIGLGAFAASMIFGASIGAGSLGFAAVSGILVLSVSLYGLVLLTRAIGMSDPTEALALPNGSVRALLALVLAIVFVAVASWTLGGLFDAVGPAVDTESNINVSKDSEITKTYPVDKYIISKVVKGDTEDVKVYLKRDLPDKDAIDIAKQVITITATVLVTIVGFYFGSKTASDGVTTPGDTLKAVQMALAGQNAPNGTQSQASDAGKAASAIAAMAKTTTSDMAAAIDFAKSAGHEPLDVLQKAAQGHNELAAALATATSAYATMQAASKTCADLDQQAKSLVSAPDGADRLSKLQEQAEQANHDFAQAQAAFLSARDQILKVGAVG
ncbi:MAG: hypothetical protein WAK41_22385 [Roseiarcus sp.]|uniref:hypothetical protein n=1 Tax=Roseiarcus sp. TaxID=1969460 RepID=UPI003BAE2477